MRSAAFCSVEALREHIARRHPSAAKASAVALPSPWLEAATIATLPFNPRSISAEIINGVWHRNSCLASASEFSEFAAESKRHGPTLGRQEARRQTLAVRAAWKILFKHG